jgi:hypothetical protein
MPAVAHISVNLDEVVRLSRDLTKECWATTWNLDSVIILGTRPAKDLRDAVKNLARTFCVCHLAANPKEEKKPVKDKDVIKGTGTIRYVRVEGGFYVIDTDNGVNYDPINLPKDYAIDGLRVKFEVVERPDIVSFHMNGPIVEIIKIEKIEKSRRK